MIRRFLFAVLLLISATANAASPINSLPTVGSGVSQYPLPDPAFVPSYLWVTQDGVDYKIDPLRAGYIFIGAISPQDPYVYQLWWNTSVSPTILYYYTGSQWLPLNFGGGSSCNIFTPTTSGCVPASGGGIVNYLRADGTWAPAGISGSIFTIASGFTNTVGTLNIGSQTIVQNDTLSEQFWVTPKSSSYIVNADNGGTSDTGVFLVVSGPGVIFTAPNPSLATKGNSYQFGSDGTNGFTITTVGGAATLYGCPGPGTGATVFTFDPSDVQITDDGTNYKCTSAAPISATACTSGTTNTVMKFTPSGCGDSDITDDGTDITVTAPGTIQFIGAIRGTTRTVSGTSDTLSAADCGTTVIYTSASAVTVTTFSGVATTRPCGIAIYQRGIGAVSIANGAGATNVSAHACTKTFGLYATLGLFAQPENPSEWNIMGDCSP